MEVGSQGQQHSKKERMQWVGPPHLSRGRRPRINLTGLAKQAHTGIDTTGMGTYLARAGSTLSTWIQSI